MNMIPPKLSDKIAAKLDSSPRVVVDWRNAAKWLSMRAMALAQAEVASWAALPKDWRDAVPVWLFCVIVLSTLVLGMVGRVVDQAPTPADADKGDAP